MYAHYFWRRYMYAEIHAVPAYHAGKSFFGNRFSGATR